MSIKHYNEMTPAQKNLYVALADQVEAWAKKSTVSNNETIKQMFEVCVTITLAIKALYLMKGNDINEVPAQPDTRDTAVSNDAPEQTSGNS